MSKTSPDSQVTHFLNEVTDQISYEPLRPSIRQELESHILDRMEDYESQGFTREDAESQSLKDMGDALTIGIELNEAHRIQKSPLLLFITAFLLLTGFVFSSLVIWSPVQTVYAILYYIPGVILLVFIVLKGYPLFIRYRRKLAIFIGFLYLLQISLFILSLFSGRRFGIVNTSFFATLLLVPVITTLLYFFRHSKKKLLAIFVGCTYAWLPFMYTSSWFIWEIAIIIFLLSTFGTVCFMIHREIIKGRKKYLYSAALGLLLFLGSPLLLSDSGKRTMENFLFPQNSVNRTLDDTYNAILIQELLSRTPLNHGLELTPDEMMDYGTGAWYFTRITSKKQGYDPKSVHYNVEDVTLWDILPQHYYNNYIISVFILMYGWIAGLMFIGVIGAFFFLLFTIIRKIHGHLASSLAFACGQCLLWQTVFYLLGNFGYQYSNFPNLPLISEGKLSIIFNMLLLGLIFSAYRFDHVIKEPVNYKPIIS